MLGCSCFDSGGEGSYYLQVKITVSDVNNTIYSLIQLPITTIHNLHCIKRLRTTDLK